MLLPPPVSWPPVFLFLPPGVVRDGCAAGGGVAPGKLPVPYKGIQYVGIPEFQDLGTKVSQQFAAVLAGHESVDNALKKAQEQAQSVADDGYKD